MLGAIKACQRKKKSPSGLRSVTLNTYPQGLELPIIIPVSNSIYKHIATSTPILQPYIPIKPVPRNPNLHSQTLADDSHRNTLRRTQPIAPHSHQPCTLNPLPIPIPHPIKKPKPALLHPLKLPSHTPLNPSIPPPPKEPNPPHPHIHSQRHPNPLHPTNQSINHHQQPKPQRPKTLINEGITHNPHSNLNEEKKTTHEPA